MEDLSVGKVAQRCGVNVSTLHFYERKGLIASNRNGGNQRRYGRDTIRRVSLIKAAQHLGVSLEEVKEAFASLPTFRAPDQQEWATMAIQWQQQLTQRIASLTRLRDSLDGCIGCGCLSMKRCPIYNPHDQLEEQGPGPVLLNGPSEGTD